MKNLRLIALLPVFLLTALSASCTAEEYGIGGPLAGVKLPLFKNQHGEPAGHPGSLPEKMAAAKMKTDVQLRYKTWGPQAQSPELDLYPGSVEHWRTYMHKYLPIRSFFDRQSQLNNWIAPKIPGIRTMRIAPFRRSESNPRSWQYSWANSSILPLSSIDSFDRPIMRARP